MENVVASRRLRKNLIKDVRMQNMELLNSLTNVNNLKIKHNYNDSISRNNLEDEVEKENIKFSFKGKILFKIFISTFIVFSCLLVKLVFPTLIEQNKYINSISNQYLTDYSKEQILNHVEDISVKTYKGTKFLFPESLANIIKEKYFSKVKPYILSFSLKDSIKNIFNENKNSNTQNEQVQEENQQSSEQDIVSQNVQIDSTGKGGGEPLEEQVTEKEDSSSLSTMDIDTNEILSKKISIIRPVEGVITSNYGARDQIFEGVNSYHTGIDIANKLNTDIKSATTGKVKDVVSNDKYYGNYIEIETNGVTFKYAHLNTALVKENDNIEQGQVIGKMGSTGMSTGSHLHFEIRINNRSVDPKNILSF